MPTVTPTAFPTASPIHLTYCEKCPVAYYKDQRGSQACEACPTGKYNMELASTSCKCDKKCDACGVSIDFYLNGFSKETFLRLAKGAFLDAVLNEVRYYSLLTSTERGDFAGDCALAASIQDVTIRTALRDKSTGVVTDPLTGATLDITKIWCQPRVQTVSLAVKTNCYERETQSSCQAADSTCQWEAIDARQLIEELNMGNSTGTGWNGIILNVSVEVLEVQKVALVQSIKESIHTDPSSLIDRFETSFTNTNNQTLAEYNFNMLDAYFIEPYIDILPLIPDDDCGWRCWLWLIIGLPLLLLLCCCIYAILFFVIRQKKVMHQRAHVQKKNAILSSYLNQTVLTSSAVSPQAEMATQVAVNEVELSMMSSVTGAGYMQSFNAGTMSSPKTMHKCIQCGLVFGPNEPHSHSLLPTATAAASLYPAAASAAASAYKPKRMAALNAAAAQPIKLTGDASTWAEMVINGTGEEYSSSAATDGGGRQANETDLVASPRSRFSSAGYGVGGMVDSYEYELAAAKAAGVDRGHGGAPTGVGIDVVRYMGAAGDGAADSSPELMTSQVAPGSSPPLAGYRGVVRGDRSITAIRRQRMLEQAEAAVPVAVGEFGMQPELMETKLYGLNEPSDEAARVTSPLANSPLEYPRSTTSPLSTRGDIGGLPLSPVQVQRQQLSASSPINNVSSVRRSFAGKKSSVRVDNEDAQSESECASCEDLEFVPVPVPSSSNSHHRGSHRGSVQVLTRGSSFSASQSNPGIDANDI
jgi:hypothetical protein